MLDRNVRIACLVVSLLVVESAAEPMRKQIETDWLKQSERWSLSGAPAGAKAAVPTWADAAGAVDGVKNGKYAFHTDKEPNPWWQVDLGRAVSIARIVVYNRLDYAPGLHNADNLIVLTSADGKKWTRRYNNRGKHFGGVKGAKPLEVTLGSDPVVARFVRLQIPSAKGVWFHLDEVEVYGPADRKKNIALNRPADQSSVSQWSTRKVRVARKAATVYPTKHTIDRGRLLAADLRRAGVDTRPFERELDGAARALGALAPDASGQAKRAVYFRARRTVRALAFANPLLNFSKLLVVKRFTQETYPDVCLNHMPWVSRPGGDICVVTLAGPERQGKARGLLNGALGPGHVHGADLWWDASRVVFGYSKAKANQPPKGWKDRPASFNLRRTEESTHIFEMKIDGSGLRQLTDGEWSDLDPTYAPNGDIVFASERCGYSLQCNEYDKDETSCNLYSMRPDGSNIRQMSVSKDGDYLPHTLNDGTIAYTRWEYQERGWAHTQSIWVIRPDGTGADALFKQHLNNPWALEDMRSIPGGGSSKLVAIATGHHTLAAGPVVVITPSVGMNSSKAIRIVTPGVKPPEGGMSGTPVDAGGVFDRGGYYMTPWALSEKYFLVSYTYGAQTDAAGYAIYLIDVFGTKELLYRDENISCFIPIPLRPRPRPQITLGRTDPTKRHATCMVANITHGAEPITPDRARYIRIAQRLPWPYDNTHGGHRYTEKGRPSNWTPVRVLGTVPVETDGSAHFRVPSDTPVYFQLLDKDHMELRRMRSFISFQRGEVRSCVGCHETRAEAPPNSNSAPPKALRRAASIPAPPPWGNRPISFLRDVQPVFDKHCVRCHSGLKPAGGLDFHGGLTADGSVVGYGHNRAFDTIIKRRLVACSPVQGDASITRPLAFGSHKSKLVRVLRSGACSKRAKLSDQEWLRLVTWIDANAPYHDGFVKKRTAEQPYGLPNDHGLIKHITAIHARRCVSCHVPRQISRADWIDIRQPARSLFLAAPLAKAAGGTGKCKAVYRGKEDSDYQTVLKAVTKAVRKCWRRPRRRDLRTLEAPAGMTAPRSSSTP
jgi:hypothetical protein